MAVGQLVVKGRNLYFKDQSLDSGGTQLARRNSEKPSMGVEPRKPHGQGGSDFIQSDQQIT